MDNLGSCVRVPIRVEQMRLVKNLTRVNVSGEQLDKANFVDGIKVNVFSEKPFTVNAYWMVKINSLYGELQMDWKTMRDSIWNNTFLQKDMSHMQNEPQIYYETREEVECVVKPPKTIDLSKFSKLPRDFYPLVVFVTCFEEEANSDSTDAAANIHIIHIKDDVVPIRSHVIKQFSKQIDGKILDISNVYAQDADSCMICLEESKANLFCLLPCRHSSVCGNCLVLITQCPICRGPITSVFNIVNPTEVTPRPANIPTIDPHIRHLYDQNGSNNTSHDRQSGFFHSMKSWFGMG